MAKFIIVSVFGLIIGIVAGILIINSESAIPFHIKTPAPKQVIGFLPYWQLDKANQNEEKYLTTLTYFALNVDGNGNVVKLINEQQEEPGWYELHSDKLRSIIENAKKNNIKLSLLISSGDANAINQLVEKPTQHANTLINDVAPIMKQYHFTDLNLDIEDTTPASGSAQAHFTQFIKIVKQLLAKEKLGTLTLEISSADTVKYNLINISGIEPYADDIVLMAYDFHSPDSVVTGPVAPLNGAGKDSEYDVTTAVERTLQNVPPNKLLLGMPLYGYEWETLNTAVRSAVIPGSGVIASNNRAEALLSECASCSAFFDNESAEAFAEYSDPTTGTYHQISFPDQQSIHAKLVFANKESLAGLALWALGYEGNTILSPLANYK